MSPAATANPTLRLAYTRSPAATAVMLRGNRPVQPARKRVAAVSRPIGPFPTLAATDPRWVLALRAADELQGGRAALLTPERRRALLVLAGRMGLRPFDASLVIAIVQDAARAGQDPLGSLSESRLALVPSAHAHPARTVPAVGLLLISAALGTGLFIGLIAWLGAV